MGIRSKILLAFLACFGILAGVGLTLLQRSLDTRFEALERRELVADMGRVLHGLDAALASLNSLTRDWAEWSDMYDYARAPAAHAAWAKSAFDPQSLESADLSVVLVYGPQWQVLTRIQAKSQTQDIAVSTQHLQDYEAASKAKPHGARCGIVDTNLGLLMQCWARIARSDLSGDFVGTVLMGRLLTPARLVQLREQTGLDFTLRATFKREDDLALWPSALSAGRLGGSDIWTRHTSDTYHLLYPLRDISQADVGVIVVQVPRDMYAQGQALFQQVRRQLVWTALGMALLLGWSLHVLLVRRLRRFTSQLLSLSHQAAWDRRIGIQGRDELGVLATEVNTMLGMIESQVQALTAMTLTDKLTALPNRRAFDARLALESARERRTGQPLALLVLDVDHFKRYNDHYGHPAGDAVLQAVAEVLRSACGRAVDMAARTGGEEFAVLLPHAAMQGAVDMALRIQQLLRDRNIPHADSPVADRLTVSIGIAMGAADSTEDLVQRADQALYTAKGGGRNCYHCDILFV
jgi:diguanylate cyclase (GGDEF)-like protein